MLTSMPHFCLKVVKKGPPVPSAAGRPPPSSSTSGEEGEKEDQANLSAPVVSLTADELMELRLRIESEVKAELVSQTACVNCL